MNALDQLNAHLGRVERRLRWAAATRGFALLSASALAATLLAVLVTNHFAFSASSVAVAQWLLYLVLALTAGFALAWPVMRLSRAMAARRVEKNRPDLEQRLVTVAERSEPSRAPEPFLELLAAETLEQIEQAGKSSLPRLRNAAAYTAAGAASVGSLIWLVLAGPGFLGYGAALLWAGPERAAIAPYYAIVVSPGHATLRRHADQLVTARLVGFQAAEAKLAARYQGTSKWEEAVMRPEPSGAGFQLLLAGVAESLDYYVAAGRLRSPTYTLRVVDLPSIRNIRVTYRYPAWTGLPEATEDPGGDLRAVQGTEAEITVETDQPLENGALVLDEDRRLPLEGKTANQRAARLRIEKDGRYHIAVRDKNQWVRLSEDYLILAEKDAPPEVRIRRPGRDARVSPIEEVTVVVEAADEFGLREVTLNYRVNGGPEQKVALLPRAGPKQAVGGATLYLEDFGLVPGDVVSLYATARGPRQLAQTDIYFLQAEPFEREYSQSQQMAGGEGEGGDQDENRISERQKEIIAATWNQIRERSRDAETARFLAGVQSRLRDQARSLARRMQSRELSLANQEFQTFSREMENAAQAMDAAAGRLSAAQWQEALGPEQKALQHLLRAEATFRQIQVAFGSRGGRGGGGRGSAGRELESLFELELDTEKNQYETAQRAGARNPQQRELDEALRKLEELARRQQELLSPREPRQSFEQRWRQEMLRREAEQLQRQMERLARQGAGGQTNQSSSQADSSAGSQSSTSATRSERLRALGRSPVDPRVQQALERLAQAARDMARPGGQQQAAERLREARDLLSRIQRQQAGDRVSDMARRSERLAEQQRDFAERLRRAYGEQQGRAPREQAERLAEEKQRMLAELESLERDLNQAARELAGGQRAAASRLREALGDLQRQDLATRMRYNAELIRRGWGQLAIMREAPITAALNQLRDQLREAEAVLDRAAPSSDTLASALEDLRRLRQRLAQQQAAENQRSQGGGQQGGAQQPGTNEAGTGREGAPRGSWAARRQGAGGPAPGSYAAMNFGDWQPGEPAAGQRAPDPAELAQAYRDALRDLASLRTALREVPEEARQIEELLRQYAAFDPRRTPGNPELLERIRVRFLADLDRLELEWRRRLGDSQGEQARSPANEPPPPGYAEAVAEYFRRLGRQR